MNAKLKERLKAMADTPSMQIKRLAIGTGISLSAMLVMVLSSDLEITWLFYLLATIVIIGVIYAIPGYIGIWVWRMQDVIFASKDNSENK